MSNPCPYCGLDVDIDYVAEGFEPFNQGDILVCDGCGCVEVATGVLWETRLPNPEETGLIRRAIEVSRRPATEHHFAHRLGPPATDKQRRGQHAP